MLHSLAILVLAAGATSWPITGVAPLDYQEPSLKPFFNPTFGFDMNVNAAFSGSPDFVHDGTDSVLWALTEPVGTRVTADSTARPQNGTKSIEWDNGNVGDIMQLARASTINVADYVALTLSVNVDSDWDVLDCFEIYGYDTVGAAEISGRLALEDFFQPLEFDAWHNLVIPIGNFAFTESSFDTLRIENVTRDGAKSPKFYIDDMQWEQLGAPATFTIAPSAGKIFLADTVRLIIVDDIASTVANGTMHGLSYDQFMGLASLPNGVLFSFTINGSTTGFPLSNFSDMAFLGGLNVETISDGVNTMVVHDVSTETPFLLDSRTGDSASITVSDDLSGTILFRSSIRGREIDAP